MLHVSASSFCFIHSFSSPLHYDSCATCLSWVIETGTRFGWVLKPCSYMTIGCVQENVRAIWYSFLFMADVHTGTSQRETCLNRGQESEYANFFKHHYTTVCNTNLQIIQIKREGGKYLNQTGETAKRKQISTIRPQQSTNQSLQSCNKLTLAWLQNNSCTIKYALLNFTVTLTLLPM